MYNIYAIYIKIYSNIIYIKIAHSFYKKKPSFFCVREPLVTNYFLGSDLNESEEGIFFLKPDIKKLSEKLTSFR